MRTDASSPDAEPSVDDTLQGPPAPRRRWVVPAVVLGVVGFAVNDSGLVVPAFVLLPLLPVLAAAGRAPDA